MKLFQTVTLLLAFCLAVGCSRPQHTATAEKIFIDRVDIDWGQGSENNEFNLLVRNGNSEAISGNVEFEVELDLTKVPVDDLEKSLGSLDRKELVEKIEESMQIGKTSPYLEALHRYLKGDWEKDGSEGFLVVKLEDGESREYVIKTNETLSMGAGETVMILKNLVIPSHYTPRKPSVTVSKYSPK